MKVNRRINKSARKLKNLGLYKHDRGEILKEVYSLKSRFFTSRPERLEYELGNFIAYNNGKTFYQKRSESLTVDATETDLRFRKDVIYDAIFG